MMKSRGLILAGVLVCFLATGAIDSHKAFAGDDLVLGPVTAVPGWEPNPNTSPEMSYVSPQADFMLVGIGGRYPSRYIASRTLNAETGIWGPAVSLGLTFPDNTTGYLSPNNDTLFFSSGVPVGFVHRAYWSGSSWISGERIPGLDNPGVNEASWHPMFNGSQLFFAIAMQATNIAVSDYNPSTNQFSECTLIDEINTDYYEVSPWVSDDGFLLLFQSDRPGGYGGFDIWSASRDESSQVWANVTNLGPDVNTSENEWLPRIAEEAHLLFFTRDGALMQAPVLPPNSLPTANARANITISSEEIATGEIQGTATDEDPDDVLEYQWKEGENILLSWTPVGEAGECPLDLSTISIDVGSHTLILEVSDGKAASSDDMILTIDNSASHAAPTGCGVYEVYTPVTLQGEVSDFDGDPLDYEWKEGGNILCFGSIGTTVGGDPVQLPQCTISNLNLGSHDILLQVNDGINDPVAASCAVTIVDTTDPTLAPVANRTILWPPNHKMVDITIEANVNDNSGTVALTTTVTSNEPIDGLDDEDAAPDWTEPVIDQQAGIITLQLRAERSGSGDGRVYTVAITATDDSGNSSSVGVEIIVPHDKRKK